MSQTKRTAVEPHKERSLRTPRTDRRDTTGAEVGKEFIVPFHIVQHLTAPLFTVFEGSHSGNGRKERRLVQLIRLQPAKEATAKTLVGDNGIGAHNPCNIERLGRSTKGNAARCGLVAHRSERNVAVAPKRHIAMYFVADDDDTALMAKSGKTPKRGGVPYHSGRVVRVGEDKHTTLVVCHLCQVVKVHLIAFARLAKRIVYHLNAISLRDQAERMVDWRLDDDLLARSEKHVEGHTNTLYDARNKAEPFACGLPTMACGNPFHHRRPILLRLHGIAEERMFETRLQSICNDRRCFKIHVRHPQGGKVGITVAFLQGIVLQGTRTTAFNNLVEIIFHLSVNQAIR